MRILSFISSSIITIALIILLDNKLGKIPPLGRFLSPQQGFWQNAESASASLDEQIPTRGLKGKVTVYLDDRLVPHIFAEQNTDAYFVQGYLHAKYRLWQMELQTYAAAGRISEKLGNDPKFINYDREKRRQGMVFGAENALKAMEADPVSKATFDAYTAGVNAYINSLTLSTLPLEYKLLDYKPEPWSNLKIALFLKEMSKTLSDYGPDLENTSTKPSLSFNELMKLEPEVYDSLVPIVPKGTAFAAPGIVPVKPASADSLYFGKKDTAVVTAFDPQNPNNGSNNWVVSGKKTKSGAPILCNDPHLELNLPSIWYEMQINTPEVNAYGVTFPGAPNVIIGFNNDIAWGVTNAMRDVKDYFEIEFKDDTKQEYKLNGNWEKTKIKIEEIKVRGGATVYDTVAYTVFGPVMYDRSFSGKLSNGKAIALRWTAHDPSNEGNTFYKLNRAHNYDEYVDAISTYQTPGQNFVFASTAGDIALWQQGKFPARWYGQGKYLMPGTDTSYAWQGFIPQAENPHAHLDSGFLFSANQRPVDSTYPYFIPGEYINPRAVSIARHLDTMQNITPQDMMRLQNDNYSVFAEGARAMLLKYIKENNLNDREKKYLELVKLWNLQANAASTGVTIYQQWIDAFRNNVWSDEWAQNNWLIKYPTDQTLLEAINRDSAFAYIDDVKTSNKETIQDVVTKSFKQIIPALQHEEAVDSLEWAQHKNPVILHLLKAALMPFARKIAVGGWGNTINATTNDHGPSWRMIVQMGSPIEAYGVYPGGQSGNPGSKYFDNMVDTWAAGKYYPLWVMKGNELGDKRIIGTLTFTNS